MNAPRPTFFNRLAGFLRFVFWGLLVLILVLTFLGRGSVEAERTAAIEKIQESRKSRVIALIHQQAIDLPTLAGHAQSGDLPRHFCREIRGAAV